VIAVIVTIIVALGVKNSVGFNNVLNVLNLAVWVFIMIAGLFFVNGKYWAEGQFLPHGWSGVSSFLKAGIPGTCSAFHSGTNPSLIFKKMLLFPIIIMTPSSSF
jgi:amino acid transporter